MAKRKKRVDEEPRTLTPKEVRLDARRRERDRRYWTIIGSVLGVAMLIVIAGVVNEFLIKPNSTLATVGETQIVTRDFWQQTRLDYNRLQNQLLQLRQFEQQFGAQPFLSAQINEIQATLASPFALGLYTLDRMIEQIIIRREAQTRGIVVTDAEIEDLLREEIAGMQGVVTEPQATATAEAAVEATAVAAAWTPTPVPTPDASGAVTETVALPTPEPLPTRPLLTDETYSEGLAELTTNLSDNAGLTIDDYRTLLRDRLLSERLEEVISAGDVETTEEQVHARHILLNVRDPEDVTADDPELAPEPRDEAETLALAFELRERLLTGEMFEVLAMEYSDDTGSAFSGGDLGWFGRGRMVPSFEEAAFSLEEGEISQPIRSDFGYHLIQLIERDDARPKDDAAIQQARQELFATWLSEQVSAANVERPIDLASRMPRNLRSGGPLGGVFP